LSTKLKASRIGSSSDHSVSDGLVVENLNRGVARKLGLGQVYAVASNRSPIDLAGVLSEVIVFYHLVNNLIAEHAVTLFFEVAEEGR
jgi:hypothetical protein